MYKEYLRIKEVDKYDLNYIDKVNFTFNNEELFETFKRKGFKAYDIVTKAVLFNNEFFNFFKSKFNEMNNRDVVLLAERLFVSSIEELNRMSHEEILEKQKSWKFITNEIWCKFIEDLGQKSKLYLYHWEFETIDVVEALKENNLYHLLNFMGTKVFVEYKGIDINYYGYEDIKLISLMWFDKFIIGFKKNIEKFDFSKKNINEYIDDIELICFLHNDYGYAKLLISEEANIF